MTTPDYTQPGSPDGTVPPAAPPAYETPSAPDQAIYGQQPTYEAPQQPSYEAPQPTYGAQQPTYGAPPPEYGAYPQSNYTGYAQPAYGGYPTAPKTNTLAIVALISGISAFVFLPFIGSIAAIITGHMSLNQLKTSGENGRGLGLTGLILGYVGLGLAILGTIAVVLWFGAIFATIPDGTFDSYS